MSKEPKFFGSVSLDYWPPQDWFRLKYYPYKNGKSFQLNLGPIRIDFARN